MTDLLKVLLSEENVMSYVSTGLRILLIWFIATVAYNLINKGLRSRLKRVMESSRGGDSVDKSLTLIPIIQKILKIGLWTIAGILVLGELGINTSALIAGIGMFGLALGLAAQTIIKDFIAGFLLIVENLISVGDSIVVGNIKGTVEHVGIRYTQIRLFSGELRVIPNSDLSNFGNKNRGFMRVIVNVGLAYEQDLEKALLVMQETASLWAKENTDIIIEYPTVQAVTEFGESSVMVRIVATVKPGEQGNAERAIRRHLKQKFDERNVDMPFPRRVLYLHSEPSQDFSVNVDDLDILPEPGSEKELKDPSLSGMVMQREAKKMSGAMDKLKNMFDKMDKPDKDENKKE